MAAVIFPALAIMGCVTPPQLSVRAERYRIDVRLDPASHELAGRTVVDLACLEDAPLPPDGPSLPLGNT